MNRHYVMPEQVRNTLGKPLGTLFHTDATHNPAKAACEYIHQKKPILFVSVGDVCTETLEEQGCTPNLTIIDFKTQRGEWKTVKTVPRKEINVKNPKGTISLATRRILQEIIAESKHKLMRVIVDGEEDLLVIPLAIDSPDGTIITYGQPPMVGEGKEGIVVLEVDNTLRNTCQQLLEQFIIKDEE